MFYALVIQPKFGNDLSELINAIRREYDPSSEFTKPHITVIFPVPGSVGKEQLIDHIQDELSRWEPFEIQLGGFHRSHDHWLFLTLIEGEELVKQLYQALYTGILTEYRRDDIEFVPHISLGQFMQKGLTYSLDNNHESHFDRLRFEKALQQAKNLPLPGSIFVEKLELLEISNGLIEWSTGKRSSIPRETLVTEVRDFQLGKKPIN